MSADRLSAVNDRERDAEQTAALTDTLYAPTPTITRTLVAFGGFMIIVTTADLIFVLRCDTGEALIDIRRLRFLVNPTDPKLAWRTAAWPTQVSRSQVGVCHTLFERGT
jgi:hypothetical protein